LKIKLLFFFLPGNECFLLHKVILLSQITKIFILTHGNADPVVNNSETSLFKTIIPLIRSRFLLIW